MNDDLDLTLYSDSSELVNAASHEAMDVISTTLLKKKFAHIALTGGTLGSELADSLIALINKVDDLSGLHIWFSDERFVSKDSSERNARAVVDNLDNPTVAVHQMGSTDDFKSVQEAADAYNLELKDVLMDLCILGLGPDGHVASLFPGHWDSQNKKDQISKAIAIIDSPKSPSERVSFSMNFINSALQVWIIAAGEAKAQAVTQVLEADLSVPAAHVMAQELTRLIVDTEAFFTE